MRTSRVHTHLARAGTRQLPHFFRPLCARAQVYSSMFSWDIQQQQRLLIGWYLHPGGKRVRCRLA